MDLDVPITLRFHKLSDHAFTPQRCSAFAAGLDIRSAYDYVIPARGKQLVSTQLSFEMPTGSYGRLAPRSGLAAKHFIDVGAGVIDADYRGEVCVVLFNHSDSDYNVCRGDRIAQLICERIYYPELEEVHNLSNTHRGIKGFGSTGIM